MKTAEMLAQIELQDSVEEESTMQVRHCTLSTWKTTQSLPISRIVICDNGNEEYVASRNLTSFERVLKDVRPSLTDLDEATKLLQTALPANLLLLPDEKSDYINEKTGRRQAAQIQNSSIVFVCNDFLSGKVLRLAFGSDYDLIVNEVGDGIEMDFL